MEVWSELVSSYPANPEPKHLAKALRIAENLLTADLALFEIEWLVSTLLYKPVGVFNTISNKNDSEEWLKSIAYSFKVISKIVTKYWTSLENDCQHIVELCMLPFDPLTRKDAINCLIAVLKNPGVTVGNVRALVMSLEARTTCIAPLAQLIGTICRCNPESVDQEYTRIWRIYLKMLQPKDVTDTVVNAVLQGMDGLFEHFGTELPIAELNDFYKKFSRQFAKIYKCLETLLSILKSHAGLFKERLSEDQVLRLYLWGLNSPNVKGALMSVYEVVFQDASKRTIQNIIQAEIQPRLESESSLVKHTALRIAIRTKLHHQIYIPGMYRPDELEYQMRSRMISQQDADMVSVCLSSHEAYCRSLLDTAILYYDHIPEALRRDVVVNGISGASAEDRKVALHLLVELSRQDGGLAKYSEVWRGILNPEDNYSTSHNVLEDTIRHIAAILKSYVDASVVNVDQVLSLSSVLSFILSASETDIAPECCELLKPIIAELSSALCMSPLTLLSPKFVCVEMFKNDGILNELLISLQTNTYKDHMEKFAAVQEIFAKETADTKLLIKGVSEMDNLLKSNMNLDPRAVNNVMKNILKLKSKKDMSTSENRVLLRNISMFEGEHRQYVAKENFNDHIYCIEMKNRININISNYEIDLLRVLQISLLWEDAETLYCLLVIIAANLRDRPSTTLQSIAWRCIHGLFKSNISIDVTPVMKMCHTIECLREVIKSIHTELNPEVRRQLCVSLQTMLLNEPGSDVTAALLNHVADELVIMLTSPDDHIYGCAIDIARILHAILRQNDDLSIKYLPKIITLISRNLPKDVYTQTTDLYIEKIAIFTDNNIKVLISDIVNNMLVINNKMHLEYILMFLKKVFELKSYKVCELYDCIFENLDESKANIGEPTFANVLQILAISKPIFVLDDITIKCIILDNSYDLFNKIENVLDTNNVGVIANVLKFLKQYAGQLINYNKEETIKCLCKLLENVPPASVPILEKDLSACLFTYKDIIEEIKPSFYKWCEHLNIEQLNDKLNEKLSASIPTIDNSDKFSDNIESLRIMCKILNMSVANTENWTMLLLGNDDKLKSSTVSDILSVSEKSLTLSEFENILKENEDFVKKYLNVYFEKIVQGRIIKKSDFFMYLLNYFVNNYNRYQDYYDGVLDLIEKHWPIDDNIELKLAIASDILKLPANGSLTTPVQWVVSAIVQDAISLDQKIRMISLLPGGEEFSGCYRHMAGVLPTRLSEIRGDHAAVLRSLLDCLTTTADCTLLDIIIILAAADDSKGWWDDAIEACMISLADRRDHKIYDTAYAACKKRTGMGVCTRVFVPLLKHTTRAFCEEYTSRIIQEVLSSLKSGYKEPSNTDIYRERVLTYTKAFAILHAIIEKLSPKSLESGMLNMNAGVREQWYIVKTICIWSVTLMNKVRCPDNASEDIRQAVLGLQCAAYNCMTTAICKRRPSQKQYMHLFNATAWSKVVDPTVEHIFKLRSYWADNKPRQQKDGNTAASTAFTRTLRTRIFMTTLSENPLQYDMLPNDDDEEDTEETTPVVNNYHPLNTHGCLTTITNLIQHATTLEHTDWLFKIQDGLTSELHQNAKFMIAQAICFAETDLKAHASVLTPALLELITSTTKDINGKRLLNNLHVDILWTIIKWNIPELQNYQHLNLTVQYLIHTCIEYRSHETVSRRLLNTLNGLLQVYGPKVQISWSVFEEYTNELPQNSSHLLSIFQRILKNGIALPDLLPLIFAKFDAKLWPSTAKLPEVFGLALSLAFKQDYLERFWHILGSLKSQVSGFVKILLYAQRACPRVCNDRFFRNIVDLASKVEQTKCLNIIAVYLDNSSVDDRSIHEVFDTIALRELLDTHTVDAMKVIHGGFKFMDDALKDDVVASIGQNCRSGSVVVRKQAFTVMVKVFQDLAQIKDENPSKRRAFSGTPLLQILRSANQQIISKVSQGMFDPEQDIAEMSRKAVDSCLSKDMSQRFAELFYLIFYFAKSDCLSFSKYGYVFLQLLFRDMKQQDGFQNKKISEHPLPVSDINIGYSTYTSGVTYRQTHAFIRTEPRTVDVQMSVADMFEVFLLSAKGNSEICEELCIQMMKKVATEASGPRFNLGEVMAEILAHVLDKEPNCLTPLFLEASRIFLNDISNINGVKESLQLLRSKTRDDSLLYLNIVYEDFILKTEGRNFFDFSNAEDFDVEMKNENQEFSIQGLMEAFGHLANWDDLRIQDKRRIEESLPPLLVGGEEFESAVHQYFENSALDYDNWFNKMTGVYCSHKLSKSLVQYKEDWLKHAQKWPTRDFVTSAVIEAMKWPQETTPKACEIKIRDCLSEWAGRLMIRSAYYEEDSQSVCLSDELMWCREAIRRQLPTIALQCIERNQSLLTEDDAMPWFVEKVEARRLLALKKEDDTMLRMTLEAAERQNNKSDVGLQRLIIQIHEDLGNLSKSDLNAIFENIHSNIQDGVSTNDKKNLKYIYDMAMNHYDDLWGDLNTEQNDIVDYMIEIIQKYLQYDLSIDNNLLLSILLYRLSDYSGTLSENVARNLLDMIVTMLPNLDKYTLSHIRAMSHIFPNEVLLRYPAVFEDDSGTVCKHYLRLICDPQYTLVQCCHKLKYAKDADEFKNIFNKMTSTIFCDDNEGTEYLLLDNIKRKLNAIEDETIEQRKKSLSSIIEELNAKPQRSGLRLSQLSPQLTKPSVLEAQEGAFSKLLGLPSHVKVVKFNEQVQVFLDSIRRPCVISVLLSTGITKRYIIKTGEPLHIDASALRAVSVLPKILNGEVRSYNVTTLDEESAIIEYLEDHERLRVLMGDKVNVPLNRLADESLVLSPSLALEQYDTMCAKIPINILRSAIENRCASVQEFIFKKRIFLETLSTMTITNWLFGVGDRHLHNLMWSKTDGGVCGVDWASVFQFGGREFVPARLTAALLAVCDIHVLEARLQNVLESLRHNQKLYEAYIRISFYWKEKDFKEISYIIGILKGSMVSHEIATDVIENSSNITQKNNYIQLMQSVFENHVPKQTYTVEEQVSCLLQHCTDPRLLSVVPRGWEPWV